MVYKHKGILLSDLKKNKRVKEYESTGYYVTNQGEIYRTLIDGSLKQVRPYVRPDGFNVVTVNHKGRRYLRYVHIIVATCFLKSRPGYNFVIHKDGNKSNNQASNLKYYQHHEVIKMNIRKGAYKKGFMRELSRLDDKELEYIRRSKLSAKALANKLKDKEVRPETIQKIKDQGI